MLVIVAVNVNEHCTTCTPGASYRNMNTVTTTFYEDQTLPMLVWKCRCMHTTAAMHVTTSMNSATTAIATQLKSYYVAIHYYILKPSKILQETPEGTCLAPP